jgi:hypothetical protein
MFHYKGYVGQLEIDEESGFLFGRVLDIRDEVLVDAADKVISSG